MKKFSIYFLIIAIISAIIGFSGFEFSGILIVRIICLFAIIGLIISYIDTVLDSQKRKGKKNSGL